MEESEQQCFCTAEQPAFGISHWVKPIYFLDTITGAASIQDKIVAIFVYIADIFLGIMARSGAKNVGQKETLRNWMPLLTSRQFGFVIF